MRGVLHLHGATADTTPGPRPATREGWSDFDLVPQVAGVPAGALGPTFTDTHANLTGLLVRVLDADLRRPLDNALASLGNPVPAATFRVDAPDDESWLRLG